MSVENRQLFKYRKGGHREPRMAEAVNNLEIYLIRAQAVSCNFLMQLLVG